MADIQRQGSAKPQTWQDGTAVSNVLAIGDGTRAEAMSALGYGWDVGTSTWIKVTAKPASTAPLATDPALVVTLSPNSPAPGTQTVSGTVTAAQATAASLNATVVQGNAGSNAQAWWARIGDATNGPAAVKAASAIVAATDPALAVQQSPQRADASLLAQTATGNAAAGVTLTLASGGAGLFHYITYIQIVKFATALLTAAAAPVVVTTTNLNNTPAFSFSAAASAQGTNEVQLVTPTTPWKSSAAATATTIVCPATTATIWRVNVIYYTAP